VIELDDLTVALGGTPILRDVTLTVKQGTFLAVVGPNGAGKTTLLRAVNGLLEPRSGEVQVGGTSVTDLSARDLARRVATVPQETSLGFDFDARSIVEMGRTPHRARLRGAATADELAVEQALERTNIRSLADRPVGELSGGERQRVLLARAVAQETPVLVLDEPTASLDINHQLATLSLARELVQEGRTAVAAIHDLDLAARFCDQMALLTDGEIVAIGPPSEVLTSERLAEAYGVPTEVTVNPVTGTPTVTALEGAAKGHTQPIEADDD
jgi:iron complex transport system ATP-binding protein